MESRNGTHLLDIESLAGGNPGRLVNEEYSGYAVSGGERLGYGPAKFARANDCDGCHGPDSGLTVASIDVPVDLG